MRTISVRQAEDNRHGLYVEILVSLAAAQDAKLRGREAAFDGVTDQARKACAPQAQRLGVLRAQLARAAKERQALEGQRERLLAEQKAAPHLLFGPALDTRLSALGREAAALDGRLAAAGEAERDAAGALAAAGEGAAKAVRAALAEAAARRGAALKEAMARHGQAIAAAVADDALAYLLAQAEAECLDDDRRLASAAKAVLGPLGLDGPAGAARPVAHAGDVVPPEDPPAEIDLRKPVPAAVIRLPE